MAVHGIIGRKVGMTQVFEADGTAVPVTVVQAGPCLVVQRKSVDKDGYESIQIGLVDARPDRNANGPAKARFEKAGVAPMRTLAEVGFDAGDEWKPGDKVLCDSFQEKEHVDVIGVSKGKGFAGVDRRVRVSVARHQGQPVLRPARRPAIHDEEPDRRARGRGKEPSLPARRGPGRAPFPRENHALDVRQAERQVRTG